MNWEKKCEELKAKCIRLEAEIEQLRKDLKVLARAAAEDRPEIIKSKLKFMMRYSE